MLGSVNCGSGSPAKMMVRFRTRWMLLGKLDLLVSRTSLKYIRPVEFFLLLVHASMFFHDEWTDF